MNEEYRNIFKLVNRLNKIGIKVVIHLNFPWIYLYKVNDNKVLEKYKGNHGYTIAFGNIRGDEPVKLIDRKDLFKIIRKYK